MTPEQKKAELMKWVSDYKDVQARKKKISKLKAIKSQCNPTFIGHSRPKK